MKKDLIFAPILLVVGILLGMLKATGMTAHIAISVIGALVLVAYTVVTKKQWKVPALEILTRAFYGIALLSGIVLKIKYIALLGTVHKITAGLFVLLLIVVVVLKFIAKKKK